MKALSLLLLSSLTAAPVPEMVGEGVLSTPDDETSIAVSPDGQTAAFGRRSPATSGGRALDTIWLSARRGDGWGPAEIAPFSGRHRDLAPSFSPDGFRLYFSSNRPDPAKTGTDFDLWWVERKGAGWGEPRRLPAPVNGPTHELGASIARNGTLYFSSNRPGGKGDFDLYRARPQGDGFAEPENLGEAVNTAGSELLPAVTPDERLLVFVGLGRSDERIGVHRDYAHGDLYLSEWRDGWTPSRNAGTAVNSEAAESSPSFSADGAFLYFVSERGFATLRPSRPLTYAELKRGLASIRNGMGNLYRVPTSALHLEATRSGGTRLTPAAP